MAENSTKEVEMQNLERRPRFQVNRVDGTEDEMDPLKSDEEDYVGTYAKSFRHFTREALPRMDNYRNILSIQAAVRPTLEELHNETEHGKTGTIVRMNGLRRGEVSKAENEEGILKFGWIKGVLIRNLLSIWGVMLFLRLSWVVGQAGLVQGLAIIMGCSLVTLLTAMSMSAISTNGLIKGGGTYFMISRSLGPEFGASIGLIFSLANAVACAMYTVGFCESLLDLFETFSFKIIDGDIQDMRIIGSVTILILLGIVIVGMEWESKAQMGLLVILLLAILDFFVGALMGPQSNETKAKGFVGMNIDVLVDNLSPDYRVVQGVQQDFFSVFSVFFPAASGFLAGANISGDLKDPQKAIPKGTILAIIITTISYVLMAFLASITVVRDATGNVSDFLNGTFTNCSSPCNYGLQNSFQVMELVSTIGPLIYAGCFAATLSSALASLVSAPKVFQALCKDNLYPYISFFGKGYGKSGEPVRGYVLTFFIALAFILVGNLNAIAPLISNFFLAAYALINFSTFHASLAKPVGWRPTFKYYNMWLSLVGASLCVAIMFLISWWTALLTLCSVLALYLIVQYRKPDVNWGSSTQAQTYKNALMSVQQLNRVDDHVKNYCPQILVLTGLPNSRPPLVDFAHLVTKNISLLLCGNISQSLIPHRTRSSLIFKAQNWLYYHKIKAFFAHVDDTTFDGGAQSLMQASGLGKLRPNILMMGYKGDWRTCEKNDLAMYFHVMHKALDLNLSLAILRLQEGLDYSQILKDTEITSTNIENGTTNIKQNSQENIPRNISYSQMSQASSVSDLSAPATPLPNRAGVSTNPNAGKDTPVAKSTPKLQKEHRFSRADLYRNAGGVELPKEIINNLTQFQRKQKHGIIDVWWLYDDGGLTLLLPYIISTRRNWSDCKLRVFTLANKKDDLLFEQRSMAGLLSKFRIDYSDLKLIPDITKKPSDENTSYFDSLIRDFMVENEDNDRVYVTDSELSTLKDKTNRHLRLRELLHENSMNSNLIVMTLPMPRKNVVAASLYMAWLEVLTKDMPPFLLVRGNQQSVLTFYS